MEKLIELLNEYGEYDLVEHKGEICKWDTDDEGEINIYTDYTNNIISKKFGFIKWLVENDKINRWRVENNQDYAEYLGNLPLEEYGTEVLLMLLSIADEPIDYLCNLLFKFE